MDLGLASYYMARVGAAQTEIAGMLSENFVYINLKKRQDFPEEIAFEMPAFATLLSFLFVHNRKAAPHYARSCFFFSYHYLLEVPQWAMW